MIGPHQIRPHQSSHDVNAIAVERCMNQFSRSEDERINWHASHAAERLRASAIGFLILAVYVAIVLWEAIR